LASPPDGLSFVIENVLLTYSLKMAGNADISYDIKDLIFTEIDRTSS